MQPELAVYLLKIAAVMLAAAVGFLLYILQSERHEKIKCRRTTKEAIDHLFDTVDPINPEKIQEYGDHQGLWN